MTMHSPAQPETTHKRRARARRGEGERLHDEILNAFDALLETTNNANAISIRALADELGVSPPAIYLHFPDKDALVFAACNRHFKAFQEALERADDPSLASMQRLRRIGRAYCDWGIANPEAYRIMFMDREIGPPPDMPIDQVYGLAALTRLIEIIEQGVAAHEFATTDALLIAMTLWNAVHGTTALIIAQHTSGIRDHMPAYEADPVIEHMLDTLERGLRA